MQPVAALEEVTDLPVLDPGPPESNKGSYGKVLLVAGCRGMSGAAVLCGSAALRGGAGLVRVAVPADSLTAVAASNPCCITAPLPHDDAGRFAAAAVPGAVALAKESTVVAVGPGLGRSPALTELVTAILTQFDGPLVLDADALNNLAGHTERLRGRASPLVLTPHPGEFARLLGSDVPAVQADRRGLASRFAAGHGLVLLLKGHHTLVCDGRRVYRNATGNPGMATAGSGDVLTGLIAALLAQGLDGFSAAQLGAYLHGLAGDLALADLGGIALIATDLIHYLPRAFQRWRSGA